MDSNLNEKVSQVIEIEDDVIDLDGPEKTPEEVIYEWDAKIRKKLSMFAVADNENILGDLMKEYLQSLQEMARTYEDNVSLKNKVFCHINFLYSYYVELQYCTSDNYLTNMEDILTTYCNLELEVIRPLKRKNLINREYKKRIVSVCRQIIHVLTVYLLSRHDHILHVLIKMNTNNISESCSEVLNVLYSHFLTKVPVFNLCDESFCRSYILFQKWKEIRKVEDWEGMDKIMYKMFKRTPESIKNNETLRQILMPACQSTVDIVLQLFRSFRDISNAYFKHIVAKKNIEMDDLDFNIDLGEDEPVIAVEENDEDVEFLKAYTEVEKNMSILPQNTNSSSISSEIDVYKKCKEELDDDDDDVQFVCVTTLTREQPIERRIVVDENDDSIGREDNVNLKRQEHEESIPTLVSLNSSKERDLENLNGVSKTTVESICSLIETSESCLNVTTEEEMDTRETSTPNDISEIRLPEIALVFTETETEAESETNQPKVSLVSNITQVPTPTSSPQDSDLSCNDHFQENSVRRTTVMKSVEVQANVKNYLYNDYGLTTPPFDVPGDEHNSRSVESCVYTNIGRDKNVSELNVEKSEKNVIQTRSVEIQVDPPSSKNCVYNDYGLTPPNDTSIDDHNSRLSETCLYTNIGQSHKDINHSSRKLVESDEDYVNSVEQITQTSEIVQRIEDNQENIVNEEDKDNDIDVNYDPEILPNTKKKIFTISKDEVDEIPKDLNEAFIDEHDSEYNEFEHQIDISEMTNIEDDDNEEIDVESCNDTENSPLVNEILDNRAVVCEPSETINFEIRVNSEFTHFTKDSYNGFQSNDQIDTGQKSILNTAPNIEKEPVTQKSVTATATSEITSNGQNIEKPQSTKDLSPIPGTFNGNTILKPLVSSNRTNGQTKETTSSNPTKIMYTSSQRIKAASLDDFSKFESAIQVQWSKMKENHDFEEILSGPVTKITPTKHSLLNSQDKLDIFGGISQETSLKPNASTHSRSNSPIEMTSPAYEAIDDFRNYFSDSVNGRVPPPHDVRVPQGILKKNNSSTRKKNHRIMFHESTCDHNSEERRLRSDGVLVQKRVRRDKKLNMEPRVVVERLSFIEQQMKKVLNNPPTLRVDYDKTTRYINEKDVVRCISPPRFSWMIKSYDFSRSRNNTGKVKSSIDDYCKKVSLQCEKNKSSCCNQLAEQFTKLNCNVPEEKALNLSIPEDPKPVNPESEFSNSPTFLQDSDKLVQHCLQETAIETAPPFEIKKNASFLCDNSNFYKSETCLTSTDSLSKVDSVNINKISPRPDLVEINKNPESDLINSSKDTVDDSLIQLPTAVPESYDFEKNFKNEVFSKIDWQSLEKDDSDCETRLPLKKRKLSVTNKNENEEQKKEEISYPATPMISIAEVEALHLRKLQTNNSRPFKTPAERKEMPPLPVFYNVDSDPSPIITDQFNINNHTYNNPTINYHMNNVPVPFINIPCGSYYSLPPILVPFNNVPSFDQSRINTQQQEQNYVKKENKKQGRQRRRSLTVKNREHLEKKPKKRKFESPSNSVEEPVRRKRAFRTAKKKSLDVKEVPRKGQRSTSTENNFVSKSDSEFDKLLNSGAYSNKPFRLDLTS